MAFRHMADMGKTEEEKREELAKRFSVPMEADIHDYPPGLCICLTENELRKLGVSDDDRPEVGDLMHLFAMAKVTSVSKNDRGDGPCERIELQIIALEAEDEDDEEAEEAA